MSEKHPITQPSKIKFVIFIGYFILIILAVYGVFRIYSEFRTFSEYETPFEERKELMLISNTLANLYESESMSRLLLSTSFQSNERVIYDSLQNVIYSQIETLRDFSSDSLMNSRLDSLTLLLSLKYRNITQMFNLMDSINKVPYTKKTLNTVLSRKNIDFFDKIYTVHTQDKSDTIIAQVKKKSLGRRFTDLFRTNVIDSVYLQSNKGTAISDSVMPIQNYADTVMQYVTDVILDFDKRKEVLIRQLAYKQNLMFRTNEHLSSQINSILRDMESRETEKSVLFLKEKDSALNRSSNVASRIAIAALITAIIFIMLSMRFITREQKYRRQLENAKKYAEDLLRSRERLMLTLSHDIKAPLSSIIGYIELLTKSKLQPREKYYLENMQGSSEHALELITKLLDYHRLESGKQEINLMNFSPYRLLGDIYQSFVPLAERKKLAFEFANSLNAESIYLGDAFRIRQVLNNLLSNALKFTETGKITLHASIHTARKNEILTIVVKDTGCGIGEEAKSQIFEEFVRTDSSDFQGIEGSGLGLAITRKLVLLMRGDIQVESEVGKGSVFTAYIPLKLKDKQVAGKMKITDKGKLKILFIDDDLVLLNMYAEMLRREGFSPVMCSSSPEALKVLQEMPFDMIFSDIQMPDINGFELAERLRNATFKGSKDVPLIALSARSDISESAFKEAGFTGFLAKPFTSAQLLDIIMSYTGFSSKQRKNTIVDEGFNALTAFAGNDKDAGRSIVETFIQENSLAVKKMEEALYTDDWDIIRSYAHKLLPLMRMVGADPIVTILYNLENNLRDENTVKELIKMVRIKNKEAEDFVKDHMS